MTVTLEALAPDIIHIRELVLEGRYYFYVRALTEAKRDGIAPEDIVFAILSGEVIKKYADLYRSLIYAMLPNKMPVHVVCDHSQRNMLLIVTAYIPDDRHWIVSKVRR